LLRVGQHLRQSRTCRDRRFVDVEIVCDHQKDYAHSTLACVHSSFIHETMNNTSPPFRIIMNGYRARSLFHIVDWMYYGEVSTTVISRAYERTGPSNLGKVFSMFT
uniref:BTB domain-containing protein n=1 Tax=Toxocara canis TaxID=6265 RepID=A0A183U906_TOXCA